MGPFSEFCCSSILRAGYPSFCVWVLVRVAGLILLISLTRPISHPFYRCVECGFFLHKTCIDLPNQIRPVFHDHPLTLLPSAPHDNGTFECSLCSNNCHGFVYACEECKNFYADVRCASIPLNIRHPGHDHRLSFTRIHNYNSYCYSCSSKDAYLFKCNECPFDIDYRCATLPSTARYWDHEHPLVLTYHTNDDGSDAYYCDICEKKRDPKHWYYYCAQCEYAGHPICALVNVDHFRGFQKHLVISSYINILSS
ncbi:uncharacterized protein LOC119985478 [Tripterygium wilfordii]|uniref:uncharacterized protein LOC119985478 n=1 Tax=Tripterygium wilfordii TaxID=458696 RepID=UPI0018F83F52|nr:uncharacterized protein LOC119985478 [Tripterygium wilfordii]